MPDVQRAETPGAPRIVPAGGGEVLGDAPHRRVELLCDADALHATAARLGPRQDGADLHVHREHSDLFFVLDGELTVRLGPRGDLVAVPAGTLAAVPPLVVHGFRNAGDVDVRYLNLHAPGRGFATYMRGLRDGRRVAYDQDEPPADGGRSPDDVQVAAARADGPPVQLLARDEHVEVREAAGAALGDLPATAADYEALLVLRGGLAVGRATAGAGAWVELPAGAGRPRVTAEAADTRVLHVAAGGAAATR